MQPVLTPQEMAAVDAAAPEPVDVLIERAGAAVARQAVSREQRQPASRCRRPQRERPPLQRGPARRRNLRQRLLERRDAEQRIGRPQQLYEGAARRDYVQMGDRD